MPCWSCFRLIKPLYKLTAQDAAIRADLLTASWPTWSEKIMSLNIAVSPSGFNTLWADKQHTHTQTHKQTHSSTHKHTALILKIYEAEPPQSHMKTNSVKGKTLRLCVSAHMSECERSHGHLGACVKETRTRRHMTAIIRPLRLSSHTWNLGEERIQLDRVDAGTEGSASRSVVTRTWRDRSRSLNMKKQAVCVNIVRETWGGGVKKRNEVIGYFSGLFSSLSPKGHQRL